MSKLECRNEAAAAGSSRQASIPSTSASANPENVRRLGSPLPRHCAGEGTDRRSNFSRLVLPASLFLVLFSAVGCFEIDTHVKVNEDGGATITETVRFSERLLDLDRTRTDGVKIAKLLSKETVLERMKQMGEGIQLASHVVQEGPNASRESVAVFEIADVANFRYVSPFFGHLDYADNNVLKAEVIPLTENTWWGRHSGEIALRFTHEKQPKQRPQPAEGEPVPAGPSPSELQIYRDLQPVFRDMADGMRIRFTVETYAPLRVRRGVRNGRAGTKFYDLIDFSSEQMDQYGYEFLTNEEVMLELLRGELNGPNLEENVKDHVNNFTVPIVRPTGAEEIWFRPSKPLFDRHFKGKQIKVQRGRTTVEVPARWDEIGHNPTPNEGKK